VEPVASQQFDLHCPIDLEIRDLLQAGEELVGHQNGSNPTTEVLRRALKLFVATERKRKFGVGAKPRRNRRRATDGSHIPMDVRRTVWERDGGRCTFVSDSGKRCPCRRGLQFDHIIERARGGKTTVDNLRLRCHRHNQYTAEQTFGAGFMHEKREAARQARKARETSTAAAETEPVLETVADAIARAKAMAALEACDDRDVVPWLRALGFRADEIRRAAEFCQTVDLPLEERVRVAIAYLRGMLRIRPCQPSVRAPTPASRP
jgi:5-methylcytosine-specific restriction endonuclease McrA